MLNKFQEQDLMACVEQLEDLKNKISTGFNISEYENVIKSFDEIIDIIKNINPILFNSPRVAKYNTPDGRYDPTPIINDDEEMEKNADT
jgi:hypothetical protein